MANATIVLDDYTRNILKESVAFSDDGKSARITRQLDRDKYMAVDKVFRALGGKWNKKAKAHLFDKDPREQLFGAAETGKAVVEKVVDKKVLWQQFYTPEDVARDMVRLADIKRGMWVLEPSAGQGALALYARAAGADVACIEIDPDNVAHLKRIGFDATLQADFLEMRLPLPIAIEDSRMVMELEFDRVVMNPPFRGGQEVDHVLHALKFLKRGGKLLAIMSNGVTFRQDKKYENFRQVLKTMRGDAIIPLPQYSFEESGTRVNTVLVIIDK